MAPSEVRSPRPPLRGERRRSWGPLRRELPPPVSDATTEVRVRGSRRSQARRAPGLQGRLGRASLSCRPLSRRKLLGSERDAPAEEILLVEPVARLGRERGSEGRGARIERHELRRLVSCFPRRAPLGRVLRSRRRLDRMSRRRDDQGGDGNEQSPPRLARCRRRAHHLGRCEAGAKLARSHVKSL